MNIDFSVISACLLYLSVLIGIGVVSYFKYSRDQHDFSLGNRSLNFWVTAIAAHASDMSVWLFMGFPAAIYLDGVIQAWTAFGLVFGMFLNWHFVAPKIRIASEKYNCPTLSSYFEHHFQDKSGWIRLISSFMAVLFFTFYLSSGLVGLGRVFEASMGIDYHVGIIAVVATIIIYTLLGGFVAVAWNDFFQGIFLLIVIITVPVIAWNHLPAESKVISDSFQPLLGLNQLPSGDIFNGLLLALGWGLGYFGQPHIINKFMGIDDVNKMSYAKYVGITWQIIILVAAVAIGLIGIYYFPNGMKNPELVFVNLVKELFNPFIASLMLCAIIAAALSSLDSYVLVSASTIAEDVYMRLWNKQATPLQLKKVCRIAILLMPLFSLAIAFNSNLNVWFLVQYAWSGLGSSFGPLVVASLLPIRFTSCGAICGILTGGILAAIWPILYLSTPALVVGFTANFLVLFLVSQWNFYTKSKKADV
ncbi:MAG: ycgO [Chlamydiales bacterium]|jgi:sodium/proline symporter|nr:ycgO [Chlamydiales bacterium]